MRGRNVIQIQDLYAYNESIIIVSYIIKCQLDKNKTYAFQKITKTSTFEQCMYLTVENTKILLKFFIIILFSPILEITTGVCQLDGIYRH